MQRQRSCDKAARVRDARRGGPRTLFLAFTSAPRSHSATQTAALPPRAPLCSGVSSQCRQPVSACPKRIQRQRHGRVSPSAQGAARVRSSVCATPAEEAARTAAAVCRCVGERSAAPRGRLARGGTHAFGVDVGAELAQRRAEGCYVFRCGKMQRRVASLGRNGRVSTPAAAARWATHVVYGAEVSAALAQQSAEGRMVLCEVAESGVLQRVEWRRGRVSAAIKQRVCERPRKGRRALLPPPRPAAMWRSVGTCSPARRCRQRRTSHAAL